MTIRDSASKAEISNYDVCFWLKECELRGDILLVPSAIVGRYIANCWGPQMRQVIPSLRITVMPVVEKAKPSPLNAKGRKWAQQREAEQSRLGLDES